MEEQPPGNYRIYSIPIISERGQHKFVSADGQLQSACKPRPTVINRFH
jgi:hypothetical protein